LDFIQQFFSNIVLEFNPFLDCFFFRHRIIGMDSYFIQTNLDRINRIYWIFLFELLNFLLAGA
jgi:hypothetical protein